MLIKRVVHTVAAAATIAFLGAGVAEARPVDRWDQISNPFYSGSHTDTCNGTGGKHWVHNAARWTTAPANGYIMVHYRRYRLVNGTWRFVDSQYFSGKDRYKGRRDAIGTVRGFLPVAAVRGYRSAVWVQVEFKKDDAGDDSLSHRFPAKMTEYCTRS